MITSKKGSSVTLSAEAVRRSISLFGKSALVSRANTSWLTALQKSTINQGGTNVTSQSTANAPVPGTAMGNNSLPRSTEITVSQISHVPSVIQWTQRQNLYHANAGSGSATRSAAR